jgi:hypothetical protein
MTARQLTSKLKSRNLRLSVGVPDGKKPSLFPASSTDQSDGEWGSLQFRILTEKQIVAHTDSQIDEALCQLSDDVPDTDELVTCIVEKKEKIAELTNIIRDLEARFIWDLSLVVKIQLVAENADTPIRSDQISCVDLHHLVTKIRLDRASPEHWVSHIRHEILDHLVNE